jgi:hypothetical protein
MDITAHHNSLKEQLAEHRKADSRWGEICEKMRVDRNLDREKGQQLWEVLERYQDVFAWNKGELGVR